MSSEASTAAMKALDSLMKDADTKTLNLCLDFLGKALN